jgi:hypothetical protein
MLGDPKSEITSHKYLGPFGGIWPLPEKTQSQEANVRKYARIKTKDSPPAEAAADWTKATEAPLGPTK